MRTVYVLKCQHDKYYIGSTCRPLTKRIYEHVEFKGSEWTKLHPPLAIIQSVGGADSFDEDKYTKLYMMKYGIENVRGGSYCQIKLPEYQFKTLQDEFCTVNGACFKCHKLGHYVKDCPLNQHKPIIPIKKEQSNDLSIDDWTIIDDQHQHTIDWTSRLLGFTLGFTIDLAKHYYYKYHYIYGTGP